MSASGRFHAGDCLELLRELPDNSVDLVFCSPPYEAARTYGIDFNLRGEDWVAWSLQRYIECVRVCRGLVAWNVEGQTRDFRWSASPALLMADLHRAGVRLRKPPIFKRVGIPGSGGPDWLRNDYEFIICASKGKLPWSNNTAMGHPAKFAPGGPLSNRTAEGRRINSRKNADGIRGEKRGSAPRYKKVDVANPGNVIAAKVGGGAMGSKLCHENEAPFPEKLAEFFIRSFCPPGGIVLDPFSGSGTTVCVAVHHGRNAIGFDVRQSQVDLGYRRLMEPRAISKPKSNRRQPSNTQRDLFEPRMEPNAANQ